MNRTSTAAAVDYGPHEAAMQAYLREGEERAMALGNRGPIRFGADGSLHPGILAAFSRCGFYVFEDVLGADELADVEADFHDILERLPVEKGSPVDAQGRPALGVGCKAPSLFWSKPLGDPFGGTRQANHRHPVKMTEPTPAADAPAEVVYLILGAIDARRQRFPEETPFAYQPFAASGERHRWNAEAKAGLPDYNLLDLSI